MTKENAQLAKFTRIVVINITQQLLKLYQSKTKAKSNDISLIEAKCSSNEWSLVNEFSISTAKNGINNIEGTGGTPIGTHRIAKKIGHGVAINTVFVGRKATGEIYNTELARANPRRDWILSRILWLEGLEVGVNKGTNSQGCCDTYQRYIYIHGTPDSEPMGVPLSHGCIRMRNNDVIWLFDNVDDDTIVEIIA